MHDRPEHRFRTQNVEWQARLQGVERASFKARACAVDGLATFFGKGNTLGKRLLGVRVVSLESSSSAAAPPA